MATLKEQLMKLVRSTPGLTDREMTDRLLGPGAGQQALNQVARQLASAGRIVRRQRQDGRIANYLNDAPNQDAEKAQPHLGLSAGLSEDQVKRSLQTWLESSGWQASVVWGRSPGIDIKATKNDQRWIIEAKGCGSLSPMRVNYFLSILGELLQWMDDPGAHYSIALPDMKQFRRLWQRLPRLAKPRTTISALFVDSRGAVNEVSVGPDE
jgi:hypothetical protein